MAPKTSLVCTRADSEIDFGSTGGTPPHINCATSRHSGRSFSKNRRKRLKRGSESPPKVLAISPLCPPNRDVRKGLSPSDAASFWRLPSPGGGKRPLGTCSYLFAHYSGYFSRGCEESLRRECREARTGSETRRLAHTETPLSYARSVTSFSPDFCRTSVACFFVPDAPEDADAAAERISGAGAAAVVRQRRSRRVQVRECTTAR